MRGSCALVIVVLIEVRGATMATAQVNGVELYYETAGAGPRVVLTHGSWTDGSSWAPAVALLAERYEVVTWDRRGHSRSGSGDSPGSRAEDAADLAALIEHLGGGPVHVAGNSYGAIVTLTLVTTRPELMASAAVHEPPALALLEGSPDPEISAVVASLDQELGHVTALIETGAHRAAAEHFADHVALGPGSWAQLPEPFRVIVEANAPTFLDERRDPTSGSVDTAGLAATTVPLLFTSGSESPRCFSAMIDELALLVPSARLATIAGAGHIPHATHPDQWVATLLAFHDEIATPELRATP
jgi:pimeloyl-ACP methyl ester carboxylesterase